MKDTVCAPAIIPSRFPLRQAVAIGISRVQLPSHNLLAFWFKPCSELNFPRRDFIQNCMNMIGIKEFENAVNLIMEEVNSYSLVFAKVLGKALEDKTYLPQLIEELKKDGVLSASDYNRLSTLVMVLDGIDIEVHEYGGEITEKM